MRIDVVKTLLDGRSEIPDDFRIFLNVALFSGVGGVRNVTAVNTKGSNYITFALFLKRSGTRFKFNGKVILCIAGKAPAVRPKSTLWSIERSEAGSILLAFRIYSSTI